MAEPELTPRGIEVEWIVENLARGVKLGRIVSALRDRGTANNMDESALKELAAHPAVRVACELQYRLSKSQALLAVLADLRTADSLSQDQVDRLKEPTEVSFDAYYRHNRPVVLSAIVRNDPSIDAWTPGTLASRFRGALVEVSTNRAGDPRYEDNFENHKRKIPWEDFMALLAADSVSNDTYLVARSDLLNVEPFRELLENVPLLPAVLTKEWSHEFRPRLWIGPAGTFTPLHHDDRSALLVQASGTKRVFLIDPRYSAKVYNDRYCFSTVDPRKVNCNELPDMTGVPVLGVTITTGDALLIPVGWWHAVESLTPSVSLTLTHFPDPKIWEQGYFDEVRAHPDLFSEPTLLPYPVVRAPYPSPLQ